MSAALNMQSPDADLLRFANECIAAAWKGVAIAQDFKREVLKRIEAKHFTPIDSLDQELADPLIDPIDPPDVVEVDEPDPLELERLDTDGAPAKPEPDQDDAGAHDASLQLLVADDQSDRFNEAVDGGWF